MSPARALCWCLAACGALVVGSRFVRCEAFADSVAPVTAERATSPVVRARQDAAACPAPVRAPEAAAREPRHGATSLDLQVRWSDGPPLPGATLELYRRGHAVQLVQCDAAGRARLALDGPARVGVALSRPDLPAGALAPAALEGVGREEGGGAVSHAVRVARAETATLVLRVRRAATLAGRVLDSSGAPRADLAITVLALDAPLDRRVHATLCDAAGRFELGGLAPGRHRILPVRSGSGAQVSLPEELALQEGELRWRELRLEPAARRVEATLVGADGRARSGLRVRLLHGSVPFATARSDERGRVRFRGLPGALFELGPDPRAGRRVALAAPAIDLRGLPALDLARIQVVPR